MSEEVEMDESSKKGRPKGSKNKPKRGRPKKLPEKRPVGRPKKEIEIVNENREVERYKQSKASKSTEESMLDSMLDDNKFLERGYNNKENRIINENPVDESFYYRGSKNVPVAGAEYEFTADMVLDLQKCKEDIIYFAENFFYIVTLDNGKQKIKLYEAQKRALLSLVNNRFTALMQSRQSGKALALDTPIATTKGWKTMGDITTNDLVYGSSGKPIRVTHAHEIMYNRPCYKVTFDNGEVIVADEDHQWYTESRSERTRNNKTTGSVKTTKEIYQTVKCSGSNEPRHRIPISLLGIQNKETRLSIDPYILGLWLGDGSSEAGWLIVRDRDYQHLNEKLQSNKQFDKITTRRYPYTKASYITLSSTSNVQTESLTSLIKQNNLYKNKHIPEEYYWASREQKLELLKGLIDSDGYVEKSNGVVSFYNSNKTLIDQVFRLVLELGYKPTITQKQAKLNGVNKKMSYGVNFKPRELVATIPFKAERIKLEPHTHNTLKRSQFHYITSVDPCESVPVRCISVDSKDHLYLAGKNLIPTHNSTILTIFVLWMACFHDDHRAAIVANKETTAINIFKRIRMAYEQLPNYIKPGVKEYGKTGMTLGNDSSVIVSTTTATSIRGDTLNALAIDEAAFIEPHLLEEFWSSVIPSISSGKKSKILMVSTPNGIGNKFYEIFSGAEKGTMKGWKAERIDWWEIPGRDEEWKQDMISALGGSEEKFNQEFGNQFLDDASSAVGASVIEKFKREKKEAIWTSDDQEYIVYEYPNQNNLYVIGVDVGEGIGRAASVAQVLDVTDLQNIKQVAVYGSTTIEPYHFANKLSMIGSSWGLPPMLIERNNCGAQVIDALYYKHQYEKLVSYSKISESEKYNRTRNMGVLSHTNIKFDGIQNMRYWVNHLEVVNVNDPTTISEFETFVRQPNGIFKKRSDSFFDDRIMALVWSLFILEPEICEQYFTIAEFDTQNKPMKITSNGYWEVIPEHYELRSLDINNPQIIPNLNPDNNIQTYERPFKLEFTPEEQAKYDKYQYDGMDMDSLMGMGFTPFLPPS